MTTQTDAQLLAAAKLEKTMIPPSTDAFEQILLKYEKLIYYIARKYFTSNDDALDATQDASLKIYNGLGMVTIPEDGSLKSWICTVIARTCIDALRKNRIIPFDITEDAIANALPTMPSAEEGAMAKNRTEEIQNAISTLPNDGKMVIILRDIQGLSYEEVAKALNINVGTVKSRLSRARASLKKILSKEF